MGAVECISSDDEGNVSELKDELAGLLAQLSLCLESPSSCRVVEVILCS